MDELLLIQRGRELNYALGDAQFKDILDNIKKSNNMTEEAQFQAALKQEGMTAGRSPAEYRAEHDDQPGSEH